MSLINVLTNAFKECMKLIVNLIKEKRIKSSIVIIYKQSCSMFEDYHMIQELISNRSSKRKNVFDKI